MKYLLRRYLPGHVLPTAKFGSLRTYTVEKRHAKKDAYTKKLRANVMALEGKVKLHEENEDQLGKKIIELKEAVETRNKFFSIVAHDLKSPFNGFLGMLEYLSKNALTCTRDDIARHSEELFNGAKQVYGLLDKLLEWAKLQMGKTVPVPASINLRDCLDSAIGPHKQNALAKNIAISINILQDTPNAYADNNMLEMVFANLFSNAVKFTKQDGSIFIAARKKDGGVEIRFQDFGVGMEEKTMNRLFSLDMKTSDGTGGEKGNGLGLVLVKEMVERMDGTITVKSEFGKGTAFTVTLPAQASENAG